MWVAVRSHVCASECPRRVACNVYIHAIHAERADFDESDFAVSGGCAFRRYGAGGDASRFAVLLDGDSGLGAVVYGAFREDRAAGADVVHGRCKRTGVGWSESARDGGSTTGAPAGNADRRGRRQGRVPYAARESNGPEGDDCGTDSRVERPRIYRVSVRL